MINSVLVEWQFSLTLTEEVLLRGSSLKRGGRELLCFCTSLIKTRACLSFWNLLFITLHDRKTKTKQNKKQQKQTKQKHKTNKKPKQITKETRPVGKNQKGSKHIVAPNSLWRMEGFSLFLAPSLLLWCLWSLISLTAFYFYCFLYGLQWMLQWKVSVSCCNIWMSLLKGQKLW